MIAYAASRIGLRLCIYVVTISFSLGTIVQAQGLPSDAQVQAAFGTVYNHLGLIEYCAAKGYATAADVNNMRKAAAATVSGMEVGSKARALEATGRRGEIVGKQIIGLMDPDNPAHPEEVPEGRTMSLADNARAQKASERELCTQMSAQVAPLK